MIKFKFCNFSPKPRLVKEKIDFFRYRKKRRNDEGMSVLVGKEKIKKKIKWISDRVFFSKKSASISNRILQRFLIDYRELQ